MLEDEVVPGDVHEDGATFGTTVPGAVTSTGPASLIATYTAASGVATTRVLSASAL